jgi:hypothetical protein
VKIKTKATDPVLVLEDLPPGSVILDDKNHAFMVLNADGNSHNVVNLATGETECFPKEEEVCYCPDAVLHLV